MTPDPYRCASCDKPIIGWRVCAAAPLFNGDGFLCGSCTPPELERWWVNLLVAIGGAWPTRAKRYRAVGDPNERWLAGERV